SCFKRLNSCQSRKVCFTESSNCRRTLMEQTVAQYLLRVRRSDLPKMGASIAGMRTTQEIASHFGWKTAEARKRLNELQEAGEIDGFDDSGRHVWRIPDKEFS